MKFLHIFFQSFIVRFIYVKYGNSFSSSMIIHTSRYLFDQHGFHNVGVDRISKESNVSKMTFYKYFKSKEKLIELCLEFHQETLMQQVSSILSANLKAKI